MVTDISGKIGGQTFGTGPAGSYVKNSGTPRKSITLSQQRQMQSMGTTAQKWRALTQAQRDTFNSASPQYPYLNKVGETKFYSGYAIFTMLQNYADFATLSILPVPLPKHSFAPLTLLDYTGNPYLVLLRMQGGETAVTYRLFTSLVGSDGVSNSYKNQFFIQDGGLLAGQINFNNLGTEYTTKWGVPPNSGTQYLTIDAVHNPTGQVYKNLWSGKFQY